MAAAALVVSIAAAVIAILAVVYTRRQTVAAEAQVHAAREPDIQLSVEPDPGTQPPVSGTLVITYEHGLLLEIVNIEIVVPSDPPLEVPVPTFGPGNHSRTASVGSLRPGDIVRRTIVLNPSPPQEPARFRLTCKSGSNDPWILSRAVQGPWIIREQQVIKLEFT
jgi:hypothetical protein